jgi:hypothetical protein
VSSKSVIWLKNKAREWQRGKVMNRIVGSPVVNKEVEHYPPKERNLWRILDKFFWVRYAPSAAEKSGHFTVKVPFWSSPRRTIKQLPIYRSDWSIINWTILVLCCNGTHSSSKGYQQSSLTWHREDTSFQIRVLYMTSYAAGGVCQPFYDAVSTAGGSTSCGLLFLWMETASIEGCSCQYAE